MEAAEAAQAMLCSTSKMSRIESGQAIVSPLELRTLLRLYNVPEGEAAERIQAIAAAARQRSPKFRVLPWVRAYIGMEAEAAEIWYFQIELVPGLLQTEDYIRAIATAHGSGRSPAEVERLVKIRLQRQVRLTEPAPPVLTAVLHEASLRLQVGGQDVLREQLVHLLRMAELPHVTLRLLPFTVGAHAATGSAFTILRLSDPADAQVVYLEDLWNADYVNRPEQVTAYTEAFSRLLEVSLDETDTAAMITDIMGGLR